jgi:hypothetical protein
MKEVTRMEPKFVWNDENSGSRIIIVEERKEEEDENEEK